MDQADNSVKQYWAQVSGGHQVNIQKLESRSQTGAHAGLICFHGIFTDSGYFYNPAKSYDTARWFADHGYDVLLANVRGHGNSRWPAGPRKWDWNFDTYVDNDIPQLIDLAASQCKGKLFALCHSFGGYLALAALGAHPELQGKLSGVCTLASAVNDYSDGGLKKRFQIPFASLLARTVGRMPARRLGLGSVDEPAGLMQQFASWAKSGGFRSMDGTRDYWGALGKVTLPVYAGIGAKDMFHASPARVQKLVSKLGSSDTTFEVIGRKQGFEYDFNHFNIASGKQSAEVVLPRIDEWIKQRLV